MEFICTQYWNSPVGELILGSYENKLCLCDWRYRNKREEIDKRIQKGLLSEYKMESAPIIEETKVQLMEYFKGQRTTFSISLMPVGSIFQKKVWSKLQEVKYGTTETYLGLSIALENVTAIRAVASANGANAISIIIPCHRIIGSDNRLVGYAGGLAVKKKLLDLEGVLPGNQLNLFDESK